MYQTEIGIVIKIVLSSLASQYNKAVSGSTIAATTTMENCEFSYATFARPPQILEQEEEEGEWKNSMINWLFLALATNK